MPYIRTERYFLRPTGTPDRHARRACPDRRAPARQCAGRTHLLPTARSIPHSEIETLIPALQSRRAVVICARGRKLSEGAAALLRAGGISAEVLEGGHAAWRAADLPLLPATLMPQTAL